MQNSKENLVAEQITWDDVIITHKFLSIKTEKERKFVDKSTLNAVNGHKILNIEHKRQLWKR